MHSGLHRKGGSFLNNCLTSLPYREVLITNFKTYCSFLRSWWSPGVWRESGTWIFLAFWRKPDPRFVTDPVAAPHTIRSSSRRLWRKLGITSIEED